MTVSELVSEPITHNPSVKHGKSAPNSDKSPVNGREKGGAEKRKKSDFCSDCAHGAVW